LTIEIKAVREYLNNLTDDRVKPEVVQRWIDLATAQVNAEKSEIATTESVDNAILAIAGHKVYAAYAAQYERTARGLPAPIMINLQIYEGFAVYFLGLAMRGTVGTQPIMGIVKSVITEVRDGNYDI